MTKLQVCAHVQKWSARPFPYFLSIQTHSDPTVDANDPKLKFSIFPCPIGYGRALQTIFPPAAIPLAFLRSPYLNRWQFATNGSTIGRVRPATSTCQSNSLARCRNLIVTYILEYQHACHCVRRTCFLGHADTVIL